MATWQAIVNGTTYSLSDGNPFKILSISGIGNAPVRRLEERGPFQDGSTDIGYRLDARLINMSIQIVAASLSAADTHRDTLSNIFNPRNGQTIYLRCTRDDGAVRQIDCYVVNMLDMPAELGQRDLAAQRVAVQLKAPNPIWYDPTATTTTLVPVGPPAWYTAGGLIDTADVIAQATNIGSATAFAGGVGGTVAAGSAYTLVMRTNARSSHADYMYFFYDTNHGQDYLQNIGGTASGTATWLFPGAYTNVTMTSGTAIYMVVATGSRADLYENGTAIGALPGGGAYGLNAGSATWGGEPSQPWDYSFSHVAAYKKALSASERDALSAEITNYAGGGTAVTQGTITNNGTWDEFPALMVAGGANDTIINNLTTSESLDFTGATIPANVSYVVDCRYGFKTVTDSNAVNQIAKLSDDSDLSTFHLAPGGNIIQAQATTPGTVTITHYDRYLGL